MEDWRAAVGFEGLYEVSNFGKVRHKNGLETEAVSTLTVIELILYLKTARDTPGKGHRQLPEAFIPEPMWQTKCKP